MPRRRGPKSGWSAVNKNLLGVSSSGHRKKQEIAQSSLSTPGGIRYVELSADDFYWWKTYQCVYSGGSFIIAEDGCASHVC